MEVEMAFVPIVEAFSLSHAMILDGTMTFLDALTNADQDWDVYGVNEGSIEPDTDSYSNEGDDVELSVWSWLNKADLTVQSGYISFPLIAQLTGRPLDSSTAAGGKQLFGMDLWHEDSLNVAPKPFVMRCAARDRDGTVANLLIGLYRVGFAPIKFDGPAYKDGLKINYDGTANYSLVDEVGNPFADGKRRVGRLLAVQR